MPANIVDGAFVETLTADAAKLDRSKKYELLVWKAHGEATSDSIFVRSALSISDAQWDSVFPKAGPSANAAISAAPGALTFDVTGDGFTAAAAPMGAYVAVVEAGVSPSAPTSPGVAAMEWVMPKDIQDGVLSRSLTATAEKLDRSKKYELLVWKAHGEATSDSIFVRSALSISDAQWDALDGTPNPEGQANVTSVTAAGMSVTAELRGLIGADFANGFQAGVITRGTADSVKQSDVLGAVKSSAAADGSVNQTIRLKASELDRTKQYEVLVWKADAAPGKTANVLTLPFDVTSSQWDVVFPSKNETLAGSFEWGVREKFRAYVAGPIAGGKITVTSPATGSSVYKFPQIVGGTWNEKTQTGSVKFAGNVNFWGHSGALNLNLANPEVHVLSATKAELRAPYGKGMLTIATLDLSKATKKSTDGAVTYSGVPVMLTEDGANVYFDSYLETSAAMDPATFTIGAAANVKPVTPPVTVKPTKPKPVKPIAPITSTGSGKQAGTLTWGISSGFVKYTTGPIAKGSVSTNGVGGGAGGYVFPQASSNWNTKAQTGSVQYSGVVTFTGHKGLMSESFANPVITVSSASNGTISAGGRSFGLNLAAASKSVGANGEVTWSGVPVVGAISGSGNGGGGSFGADPLSFTVGAANGASFGSTSVDAKDKKRTAAATAPATTGITVTTKASDIVAGGEIEFEASGFEPGERDVLVVVYSEPTVLDDAAGADENGVVRWIGNLPKDLPAGKHTITLQGSTNAGAVITVLDEKTATKKAEAKQQLAQGVDETAVQAAGVMGPDAGPVWLWWVGALALLAIAGTMGGLVVMQRKQAARAE